MAVVFDRNPLSIDGPTRSEAFWYFWCFGVKGTSDDETAVGCSSGARFGYSDRGDLSFDRGLCLFFPHPADG